MVILLAVAGCLATVEPARSQAKGGATASGVFLGRSGKPMAKAKIILGQVSGDDVTTYAKLKLGPGAPTVVTDDSGRFQISGFAPGRYAFIYLPAGSPPAPVPPEINIKGLAAAIKSFLPMMRDVEIGKTGTPYPDRPWAREFTLLKGHTLWCIGIGEPLMKIWNATARRGAQGFHMEIRRGVIWQNSFDDKGQVKLEAWSF
jgi:hypothetical protein